MATDPDLKPYDPTTTFTNVNNLYGNHFKFSLQKWPDVTFNVQKVSIPAVTSSAPAFPNPASALPQVGDHLTYNTFDVTYLVDRDFKTYFSLYYWMKGYGFPHGTDELQAFFAAEQARAKQARPTPHDIVTTRALLQILQPDTNGIVAEVLYEDVFPVALGELVFETTQSSAPLLTGTVTLMTSDFHVNLTNA